MLSIGSLLYLLEQGKALMLPASEFLKIQLYNLYVLALAYPLLTEFFVCSFIVLLCLRLLNKHAKNKDTELPPYIDVSTPPKKPSTSNKLSSSPHYGKQFHPIHPPTENTGSLDPVTSKVEVNSNRISEIDTKIERMNVLIKHAVEQSGDNSHTIPSEKRFVPTLSNAINAFKHICFIDRKITFDFNTEEERKAAEAADKAEADDKLDSDKAPELTKTQYQLCSSFYFSNFRFKDNQLIKKALSFSEQEIFYPSEEQLTILNEFSDTMDQYYRLISESENSGSALAFNIPHHNGKTVLTVDELKQATSEEAITSEEAAITSETVGKIDAKNLFSSLQEPKKRSSSSSHQEPKKLKKTDAFSTLLSYTTSLLTSFEVIPSTPFLPVLIQKIAAFNQEIENIQGGGDKDLALKYKIQSLKKECFEIATFLRLTLQECAEGTEPFRVKMALWGFSSYGFVGKEHNYTDITVENDENIEAQTPSLYLFCKDGVATWPLRKEKHHPILVLLEDIHNELRFRNQDHDTSLSANTSTDTTISLTPTRS